MNSCAFRRLPAKEGILALSLAIKPMVWQGFGLCFQRLCLVGVLVLAQRRYPFPIPL